MTVEYLEVAQRERIWRRRLLLALLSWFALILASFLWSYSRAVSDREDLLLHTARAFFQQIVVTRRWNAQHGGIYVPVTADTQPNPYLKDPDRDLVTVDGRKLTMLNPAYMTRQLSELAEKTSGVQFHITSLKPIRPANSASPWEAGALEQFEQGRSEVAEAFQQDGAWKFRYMAPLVTEKPCMECHERQGYHEGDIRGGISVTLPQVGDIPLLPLAVGHLIIALVGAGGLVWFGRRLARSELELHRQAFVDDLTSIPNRRYFVERLLKEARRSEEEQTPVAVLLCDIDYFKGYNDAYGQPAGDRCLQEVAGLLRGSLHRSGDFCARYGGEEFALVLPDTSLEAARRVAERLRRRVETLVIPHTGSPHGVVTVSVGIASGTARERSFEALVHSADQALYRAKQAGRNRVEVQHWGSAREQSFSAAS